VDEAWEVLNVTVTRGALRWAASVKLPLSAATAWSGDRVAFGCTSRQAFAREVPPMAAPARPLSGATPMSLAGSSLAGALVDSGRRLASKVLVRIGPGERRVPVEDVSFDGKVMRLGVQAETMPAYVDDSVIKRRVARALGGGRLLSPEDSRRLDIEVAGSVVRLRGNMRSRQAGRRAADRAAAIEGVLAVRNEIVDDGQLESAVGHALDATGIQRSAQVYARSSLGAVTLSGYATAAAAAEAVRVVSRVPGVRGVSNRIQVREGA
jgi:osmotically-inducible protein OsmY